MLRNSFTKILTLITLDNEVHPEYKKIADLNKSIFFIKEMDSANNPQEIHFAIDKLKKWRDQSSSCNHLLSMSELKNKQRILEQAQEKFNVRLYLMMALVVGNASIMGALLYFSMHDDLARETKYITSGLALLGMVEGSIHLYKAKRFFAQKCQLTTIELDSVNQEISFRKD